MNKISDQKLNTGGTPKGLNTSYQPTEFCFMLLEKKGTKKNKKKTKGGRFQKSE